MRMRWDNSLRRQSFSLPALLEEIYNDLDRQAKDILSVEEARRLERVILTGCGDSNAAGMAVRFALMENLHIPVEAALTIDVSREYPRWMLGKNTLVIGVSVSGNGVRIEEVLEKANYCGALTLAVTKNQNSGTGRLANRLLELPIPEFESGPGNRNYFACVLALLLLGLRLGEWRGTVGVDEAQKRREAIRRQGELLETEISAMDATMLRISEQWRDYPAFDFVGAGADYSAAWFGHAKILEAVGAMATHCNSEEWFHMNNFFRGPEQIGTTFVAGSCGMGFSRTREAVKYACRLGRPTLVVTEDPTLWENMGAETVRVPASVYQPATALTHYVPSCLLAGNIGAMIGEKNCRGCLGPWEFAAGGAFITGSDRMICDDTIIL